MVTEEDRIEKIDMSEKEIKSDLGDFFKKYNLVFKKKSEKGFIWGNDEYNLNFLYGAESYYWFIFQGLLIEYKDKVYNFHEIFNFMEEQLQTGYDIYKDIEYWKSYEIYMESHLIPFLNMDNIEEMDAYLKKSYPWY